MLPSNLSSINGNRQIDFRILGPLEVWVEGGQVPLAAAKERALVAILLLHANEVVSSDRLIDELWGEKAPRGAGNTLQVYISKLRKSLEAGGVSRQMLRTRPPGYVLQIEPDELDLHRFEQLFQEGEQALGDGQPDRAAGRLREALSLWRGTPLADFAFERFAQTAIARLEELHLAALEARIEVDLALGRHVGVVGELETLIAANPLRERLRGQLMLALYRSGRQAEALAAYQETRRMLVDELGIEPSPALQNLERDILLHEVGLDPPAASGTRPRRGTVTLLFTDIEGSTRLLHQLGDRYGEALAEHRRLLRAAFAERGGHEVDSQGDAFFVAFERAKDALAAVVGAQRALAAHSWPEGTDVRVRMALHTGEPAVVDGRYVGLDVHRAARMCAAGHGGQVILSRTTRDLIASDLPAEVRLRELGAHQLKDLVEPELLFQLVIADLPDEFPPLQELGEGTDTRLPATDRSILIVQQDETTFGALLALAEPLAGSHHPHELILAGLIDSSVADGVTVEAELARTADHLSERRAGLVSRGIPARIAAFTSGHPDEDIVRLASEQDVDLLLLDGGSVLPEGQFAGELAVVLAEAPCTVAVWVRRDAVFDTLPAERPVAVPFGGAEHDWAALELGAWIASAHGVPLVLLGVSADEDAGKRDASRLLASASLAVQQLVGIPAEPLLVRGGHEGILQGAKDAGLLLVGLSTEWREEGLGRVRSAIARVSSPPTLFVRRGVRPGGLAPRESLTRFTWSLSGVSKVG